MGTIAMLQAFARRTPALRSAFARSLRVTPKVFSGVPAQPDELPAGELVNDLGHANGLRREEIEAELMGKNRFETEWIGPPGTKESPIVGIPSTDDHGDEGEVRWFRLSKDDGVVEHH